ncbi:gp9 [Streptomyces phage phiSASD1]|uniref:Gp9 n=1 Tax=Streptomyces phage phiSASD1 TaxID=747763 RepID=D7NW78_9CAUD|nr:gp9 [Streptomyces phage phiSASD1]ADE43476.1 gp9 [Streptomyces phage phiSASD1]
MLRIILKGSAPALGDIRAMGQGDTIVVRRAATQRPDWPRFQDAVSVAANRGAQVHYTAQAPEPA